MLACMLSQHNTIDANIRMCQPEKSDVHRGKAMVKSLSRVD